MELTFPLHLLGIMRVFKTIYSQEYVLGEVYKDFGLSEEEITDHFTGLAFLVSIRFDDYEYSFTHSQSFLKTLARCIIHSRGTVWEIFIPGEVLFQRMFVDVNLS